MFTSILNLEQGLTILNGVVCCMSALGLGLIIAWFYRRLGYCSCLLYTSQKTVLSMWSMMRRKSMMPLLYRQSQTPDMM